ncbi:hypothetical protein FRC11_013027, partial [Ceratobasidium sp. 423]
DWYWQNCCRIFKSKQQVTSEGLALPDNCKLRQGDFSITEQKVLQAVKHFYHFEMISVDPFALDLDSVIMRALEYMDSAKSIRLEQASPAFVHFVICTLLDGDSFTNAISSDAQPSDTNNANESLHSSQGGSIQDSQKFRHPAIAAVLLAILFDMDFKFGIIFIERLCACDMEKWWHWERKDKSPKALEGMLIEAIALACTMIQHFLDIQKTQTMGECKATFEGWHYGIEWGRHMCRLINFSQLGQLQQELLNCV